MKIVKLRKRERESSIDSSTLVLTSLGHIRGNLVAHSMQNPTTYFCRGLPRIWQKIVAKMFWKQLKLDTLSKKLLRKHTL